MATIRVFNYISQLDAFVITEEFRALSERLGLIEWHPAVWIGRLFTLDNDFGEHWFDNWDEREALEARAREVGIDPYELMIIVPDRFAYGDDGPCHPPEIRKMFWTDVLKSLELSYELLFEEARLNNAIARKWDPPGGIEDLEERVAQIQMGLKSGNS